MKDTDKKQISSTPKSDKQPSQKRRSFKKTVFKGIAALLLSLLLLQLMFNIFADQLVGSVMINVTEVASDNRYKLRYDNLDVNFLLGDIEINGLEVYPDSLFLISNDSLPLEDKKDLFSLQAPHIYISGSGLRKAFLQGKLVLQDVSIDSLYVYYRQLNTHDLDSVKLNEGILGSSFLSKFTNEFEIKQLLLNNANLRHENLTSNQPEISVLKDVSLHILDFGVNKETLQNEKTPFRLDLLTITLNRNSISLPNSPYKLEVGDVSFSTLRHEIMVRGLKLKNQLNNQSIFESGNILLDSLNIKKLYLQNKLEASNVIINAPHLNLTPSILEKQDGAVMDSLPISVALKYLLINNGSGNLQHSSLPDLSINDFDFRAENFAINASSMKTAMGFNANDYHLSFRNQTFYTPDSLHEIGLDNFSFDAGDSVMAVKNLTFKPLADKFGDKLRITGKVPFLILKDFSLREMIEGNKQIKNLKIERPNLYIVSPNQQHTRSTPNTDEAYSIQDLQIENGKLSLDVPNHMAIHFQDFMLHLSNLKLAEEALSNSTILNWQSGHTSFNSYTSKLDINISNTGYRKSTDTFIINGIKINNDENESEELSNGTIDQIVLPNPSLRKKHDQFELYCDDLTIKAPNLSVYLQGDKANYDKKSIKQRFFPKSITLLGGLTKVQLQTKEGILKGRFHNDYTVIRHPYLSEDKEQPMGWGSLQTSMNQLDFIFPDSSHTATIYNLKINDNTASIKFRKGLITPLSISNNIAIDNNILIEARDVKLDGIRSDVIFSDLPIELDLFSIKSLKGILYLNQQGQNNFVKPINIKKVIAGIDGLEVYTEFKNPTYSDIGHGDVILENFQVDSTGLDASQVKLTLNKMVHSQEATGKLFKIEQLYFDEMDKDSLNIKGFETVPFEDDGSVPDSIYIEELTVSNTGLRSLRKNMAWHIRSIDIKKPYWITYIPDKPTGKWDASQVEAKLETLWQQTPSFACNDIAVSNSTLILRSSNNSGNETIELATNQPTNKKRVRRRSRDKKSMDTKIKLQSSTNTEKKIKSLYHDFKIYNINVSGRNLKVNSTLPPSEVMKALVKNIDINVGVNQFMTPDSLYTFGFDSVQLSTKRRNITVDLPYLKPLLDRSEFAPTKGYQTDCIEMNVGQLSFEDLDFNLFAADSGLVAQSMNVNKLELQDYRDRTIPSKADKQAPKLPVELLKAIPFTVKLDTVKIQDSHIKYEEYTGSFKFRRKKKTIEYEKVGTFELTDLSGEILNVTNDSAFITKNKVMRLNANAKLMGDAKVFMKCNFLLSDTNNVHTYDIWVEKMDLQKLNPLFEGLAMIRITEGKSKGLFMTVVANNDYAYGNMQFRYSDLHVAVLKEKHKRKEGILKKKKMFSSLANAVIDQDNPKLFRLRDGQVYFERDKSKFIFNYWAKSILSGILSSTGTKQPKIQEDGVKQKIRGLQKSMNKRRIRREFHFPPN
ncbi:hypothetical protein V6R21_17915 [Limibacter armeniacum]|uniref:hypothetical protein n=1 Tax=Limibacter armeniacum TaxID=466084 RepID=UPI002FE50CAE